MDTGRRDEGMVDVFAEWTENAPINRCGIPEGEAAGCSELFKVRWQESFVAEGGRRLVCHFIAPDAEAVRMTLRCANVRVEAVWSGSVHAWISTGEADSRCGTFLPPLPAGTPSAPEPARAASIAPDELVLTSVIISSDGTRVIGVCDAGEGGASLMPRATEATQKQVWRCRRFAPRTGATVIQDGLSILVWPVAQVKPGTHPPGRQAAPSRRRGTARSSATAPHRGGR